MVSQPQLKILEVVQSLKGGGRTKRFSDTVLGLRENKQFVIPLSFSQPEPWVLIPQLEVIERNDFSIYQLVNNVRRLIKKHNMQIMHAHCEFSQL